ADAVALLRVGVRELDPFPRRAPPGRPDLHLRFPAGQEELLDELRTRNRDRQMDLPRKKGVGVVELGKKRLEEGVRSHLLGFLEEELAAVLEDSAPHDENADRHVSARLEEAEG